MIEPKDLFEDIRGDRAQCPKKNPPMGCDGKERKQGPVQINPEYAHCFVCTGWWPFKDDKKRAGSRKMEIPRVSEPTVQQITEAVIKSGYSDARDAYLKYYDTIVEKMQLPWNESSKLEKYGIGVRKDEKKKLQLVFKINDDHIKYHKGSQFGDKKCKVYPHPSLLNVEKTLYIVEGEKDAITANCHGIPAITFTSGAGALPKNISYLEKYKNIAICYDNDDAGQEGAIKIAKSLYDKDRVIKIVEFADKPDRYDLTDFFNEHNVHDFNTLVDNAKTFGKNAIDLGGMATFSPSEFAKKFNKLPGSIVDSLLMEKDIMCLAGGTNVGKSVFGLQLTTSMAMGVPFMGHFNVPSPKRVLHAQFELKDESFTGMLQATSGHLLEKYPVEAPLFDQNCTILSDGQRDNFTDKYDKIEANLQHKDYDVVVIDNVYCSTEKDLSKNSSVVELLRRIVNIKQKYNISLVLINHHKKMEIQTPLDVSHILGGSAYTNHMDHITQMASTKRSDGIKVMKITKVRSRNDFHDLPLAIKLNNYEDREKKTHLYFDYLRPLPKNEMFWYTDPTESNEERVLKAIPSAATNFSLEQFKEALAETLNLTSTQTAYNWIDKMMNQGLIVKIERGHYRKLETEIDDILN